MIPAVGTTAYEVWRVKAPIRAQSRASTPQSVAKFTHSEQIKDKVIRLSQESGLTAAKIGAELGLTKGQVLGIAHRHRLALRNSKSVSAVDQSQTKRSERRRGTTAQNPSSRQRAILQKIADRHDVTLVDMLGASRFAEHVIARQEAMAVLFDMGMTKSLIGRLIGGRDHKTIIYGICKHAERVGATPASRARDGEG